MDVAVLGETIDEILKRIPSFATTTKGFRLPASDKEQLEKFLKVIHAVVHREKQNKVQNGEVLVWLRRLKTVVNDLNDSMEELSTNVSPLYRRFPFSKKIKKVIEDLQNVARELPKPSEDQARKNVAKLDPAIEESLELVGREKEKKEIIDQLISLRTKTDDVPLRVVTIVGFAGIGKTRLARLICEDVQVKAHFGLHIWVDGVHKSETFNVESVAKRVNDSPMANGKGYLVVLDDLRTEIGDKDLSKLQQMLTGPGGGAILITTRSKLVANKITANIRGNLNLVVRNITTVKPHVLQGLNEGDSWSLFSRICAPSSIDVKDDIVKDCGGVPLWIVNTATFLSNCGGVVEAQVAALKEEFLQELKIRYYDKLPRIQKLCFAFCSLFPREHSIDVERLIHLWAAEGFRMENNSMRGNAEEKELTFRGHFNDFVRRPIFKDMEEDERGVVRKCRMQPLMHDLARFVGDHVENITVDPEGEKVHEGVLRASFDFSLDVLHGIPDSLFEKAKKLRAFLLWKTHTVPRKEMRTSTSTCDKIFKTFKSLRMLDLHDLGIKTLPRSIGELKNLRYLDLSMNKIEKLPGTITKLSNLQTLKLSQCNLLKELPRNIDDLLNLRHLEIEGCSALTHMPSKIHKLSSLQTLSLFVVSKHYQYHLGVLGELASLNNLRGHLEILHLERSNSNLSEKDMYLKRKKHLQRLTLRWDHEDDGKGERDNKTMDCLEPHSELKVLSIVGYKGRTLSTWISSIQCLVKLTFFNCTGCIFLPQLDQLPNLRFLKFSRLDSIKYIQDDNNDKDKPALFFPSLEELTISDCPELKSWWKKDRREKDIPLFACISKLHVSYCPKLTSMPLYPSLDEELVLEGSSVKPLRATIVYGKRCNLFSKLKSMQIASIKENYSPPEHWLKYFSSLEKLDIREWKHLKSLPKRLDHLSSLQRLNIENCQELDLDLSSTEWEGLKSLRSLTIREIPKLKSLPLGVDKVTSMQDLELHNCPEITCLPESIGNLKSLRRLEISECNKLASLPEGLNNLESLHTLRILDCPLLLPRCYPDFGDEYW